MTTAEKIAWDYVDEAEEYVVLTPNTSVPVLSAELKYHIANEKLKVQEGLRYLHEREEMQRAMRRMDADRRVTQKKRF